jgi:hypothetical protein
MERKKKKKNLINFSFFFTFNFLFFFLMSWGVTMANMGHPLPLSLHVRFLLVVGLSFRTKLIL